MYNVNNPRFTTYASNTSVSMLLPQLYRKTGGGASYSNYSTACESGTAVEQTETAAPAVRKVIYNGQVYILREGKTYTLTGVEIK